MNINMDHIAAVFALQRLAMNVNDACACCLHAKLAFAGKYTSSACGIQTINCPMACGIAIEKV